jgi:arylsulfatase A-like enzyme
MDTYRKAHVLRRTIWIVTADHGMAPVYRTVSDTAVSGAVKAARTKVVADVYHTGAYLWVADKTKVAQAAQNITALRNPGIQSVYYKQAVGRSYRYVRASDAKLFRTSGADAATQYLLSTFAGPTGPDLAVFFTEGTASLPGGEANWKGDHGGSGWQSQHLPLLISGPGVRSGYVSAYPARLVDIAPTVLTLLGAPMGAMQGIPLTDAMTSPPSWASGWQTRVGKQVWPVVQALQAESRLESSAASAKH